MSESARRPAQKALILICGYSFSLFRAGYSGQTGERMKNRLRDARGGVLLLDEAHQLQPKKGSTNEFGQEAISALMSCIDDGSGDPLIIVCGYPKEMENWFAADHGMSRRIPRVRWARAAKSGNFCLLFVCCIFSLFLIVLAMFERLLLILTPPLLSYRLGASPSKT